MMYAVGTYLKFLFQSTNQYGVHSPFVYDYLTKCLYKRTTHKGDKILKILFKSIPYLKLSSVLLKNNNPALAKRLSQVYPFLQYDTLAADLIVIEKNQLLQIDPTWLEKHCHDESMILMEGIHHSKNSTAVWESFCEQPWVSVSIDFYDGGILFLRKEQAKQHFRIRI